MPPLPRHLQPSQLLLSEHREEVHYWRPWVQQEAEGQSAMLQRMVEMEGLLLPAQATSQAEVVVPQARTI